MHERLRTLALVSIVALAGCQGTPPKPAPPPDRVTSESELIVTTSFTIPAGGSGVYFQDNQVQSRADLSADFPYCHFELPAPVKNTLTVKPQRFRVTTVEYDEDASGPQGSFSSITRINLQYGDLPNVPRVSCRLPGGADNRRFVTPAEILGAMGAYFDLKVAP